MDGISTVGGSAPGGPSLAHDEFSTASPMGGAVSRRLGEFGPLTAVGVGFGSWDAAGGAGGKVRIPAHCFSPFIKFLHPLARGA